MSSSVAETVTIIEAALAPRHQRLSIATDALHEHLHTVVAGIAPFESRENFGRFAAAQYQFQREIEGLYQRPALQALLPELPARSRRSAAEADLADLGVALPQPDLQRTASISDAEAIGWIYVSEGSTLGAAMLFKKAQQLGLGESFGARHLAASPEGRARHWKQFVGALDALDLADESDAELLAGGVAAFRRFGEILQRPKA
jgi:heme oxygenase